MTGWKHCCYKFWGTSLALSNFNRKYCNWQGLKGFFFTTEWYRSQFALKNSKQWGMMPRILKNWFRTTLLNDISMHQGNAFIWNGVQHTNATQLWHTWVSAYYNTWEHISVCCGELHEKNYFSYFFWFICCVGFLLQMNGLPNKCRSIHKNILQIHSGCFSACILLMLFYAFHRIPVELCAGKMKHIVLFFSGTEKCWNTLCWCELCHWNPCNLLSMKKKKTLFDEEKKALHCIDCLGDLSESGQF